jgi:glucosamine-6-phosphate deaminase
LAKVANEGVFDSGRIRSFNLDEYVGLPGENIQQRAMHPESYCYFMIQEFFGLLKKKFIETSVPYGTLIDQKQLTKERIDLNNDGTIDAKERRLSWRHARARVNTDLEKSTMPIKMVGLNRQR